MLPIYTQVLGKLLPGLESARTGSGRGVTGEHLQVLKPTCRHRFFYTNIHHTDSMILFATGTTENVRKPSSRGIPSPLCLFWHWCHCRRSSRHRGSSLQVFHFCGKIIWPAARISGNRELSLRWQCRLLGNLVNFELSPFPLIFTKPNLGGAIPRNRDVCVGLRCLSCQTKIKLFLRLTCMFFCLFLFFFYMIAITAFPCLSQPFPFMRQLSILDQCHHEIKRWYKCLSHCKYFESPVQLLRKWKL